MVFDMELCNITPSISSDQGGGLEARVRQREHYKKMTFEDEFLALLEKAGVPHDQNMCWDELSAAPPALDHLHNRFPAMPGWADVWRTALRALGERRSPSQSVRSRSIIGVERPRLS
jgi:hypothetical protein